MQIVALGDVGVVDGMMHIGDEAMFEAVHDELTRRGMSTITALSAAPAETSARYGILSIARLGFPPDRDGARDRFSAVLACVAGRRDLPDDDPVWAVVDAVAAADGVVIAGGGNLASTWPSHVYERAALGALAAARGVPLVVSGQTLGPHLVAEDRELVRSLLASARLVGLREPASAALAADLGVSPARSALTLDDATFLGDPVLDGPRTGVDPFVLVSLSTHLGGRPRDAVISGLAASLDELCDATGFTVRFHAHFGSLEPGVVRGDAVLHADIAAALRAPSEIVPTGDARAAAGLARSAGMLVTGRYHPAVFAAPAGVPVAALVVDPYTDVKLRGVLGHWGQSGLLDLDAVARHSAAVVMLDLATRADAVRVTTAAMLPRHRSAAAAWWDRVAAELGSARRG